MKSILFTLILLFCACDDNPRIIEGTITNVQITAGGFNQYVGITLDDSLVIYCHRPNETIPLNKKVRITYRPGLSANFIVKLEKI